MEDFGEWGEESEKRGEKTRERADGEISEFIHLIDGIVCVQKLGI